MIDEIVGRAIGERRRQLGLSICELANALGRKPEEVEEFEAASRGVGASELHQLTCVLQMPLAYFFSDAKPPLETPEAIENLLDLVRQELAAPSRLEARNDDLDCVEWSLGQFLPRQASL